LIKYNIDKEKIEKLTNREREILAQIAEGLLNKEIASNLNISERTIKNHISSVFKKLEVSDRTQAAVFAIKNNMVKL
jgi:DNA-binding NarL/FixJ family response regulator